MSGFFKPGSGPRGLIRKSVLQRLPFRAARLLMSALVLSLFSCIGTASRITINKDGSGTLTLEYRTARELEELGKLDGNEHWPPVPADRSDLERTAARIPGLTLVSASSRQEGADTVYSAELAFAGIDALAAFLDASGRQCEADLAGKRLTMIFPANGDSSPEFKQFAEKALQGYDFALSLSLPGNAALVWLDKSGRETANFPGACVVKGNAVEYSAPMADLVFLDAALVMEIRW